MCHDSLLSAHCHAFVLFSPRAFEHHECLTPTRARARAFFKKTRCLSYESRQYGEPWRCASGHVVSRSIYGLGGDPFSLPLARIDDSRPTVEQNQVVLKQRIIHFPTSSGVSEWAGRQTDERSGHASEASSAEQANGSAVQSN